MSGTEYVVKALPALRLAARRATVTEEEIADVVGPLFDDVARRLTAVGASLITPVAQYDLTGSGMVVVAGYAHDGELDGVDAVDLPAVEQAVCADHLGPMEGIGASWQELHQWVQRNGWALAGPCREHYVRAEPADDQSSWVTELQQPVRRA